MIIAIGGDNKPLKMALEEPEELTSEEFKETLYGLIENVSPYNTKIDVNLVKEK